MRIITLTVSVGCGDQLALTLPNNRKVSERSVVVTTSTDEASQDAARRCAADLVISDACHADGHAFNKGRMLSVGLERIAGEDAWLLFTDADCFLPPNLPGALRSVVPGHFYFASRRHVPAGTAHYHPGAVTDQHLADPVGNCGPWGYFQLVHLPDLESRFRAFPPCFVSACGVDHWLMTRWPAGARIRLPLTVLHLWHGPLGHRWSGGRETDPGVWRHAGQSFTGEPTLVKTWPVPCHVRRTHLENCEQETVFLQPGDMPAWRVPTQHGVPYEYAVRK